MTYCHDRDEGQRIQNLGDIRVVQEGRLEAYAAAAARKQRSEGNKDCNLDQKRKPDTRLSMTVQFDPFSSRVHVSM